MGKRRGRNSEEGKEGRSDVLRVDGMVYGELGLMQGMICGVANLTLPGLRLSTIHWICIFFGYMTGRCETSRFPTTILTTSTLSTMDFIFTDSQKALYSLYLSRPLMEIARQTSSVAESVLGHRRTLRYRAESTGHTKCFTMGRGRRPSDPMPLPIGMRDYASRFGKCVDRVIAKRVNACFSLR